MKNVNIAGTIGKDAETRDAGQSRVTSFSVAVDHRDGKNKTTMWFDVSMWGKRGEAVAGYIKKGGKISVCGDLSTREHNGKTYLQVRADDVTLLGGGERSAGQPQQQSRQDYGGAPAGGWDLDDAIPFAAYPWALV